MLSSREFCNQDGNQHALVSVDAEVRDSLGTLAVQVLAARENLAEMNYNEMISELYDIVKDLHDAFEYELEHTVFE